MSDQRPSGPSIKIRHNGIFGQVFEDISAVADDDDICNVCGRQCVETKWLCLPDIGCIDLCDAVVKCEPCYNSGKVN